jgi:transposase
MMKQQQGIVYGGVDTHLDVHVAAVVDGTGRLLGTKSFPTSPLGLRRLERWLSGHGQVAGVGVEGTGTYGLGLQRVLQAAGHDVVEVNRPNRQLRRSKGKSDTVDAEAAARAVLAGHATSTPKSRDGIVECLRVLRLADRSMREQMTRLHGQLDHLTITAPEAIRVDMTGLSALRRARKAAACRPSDSIGDVASATKTAMRTLARQWLGLREERARLREQIEQLTTQSNPALLEMPGVGPDTSAALLIAAGDNPARLRSSAAFAALAGVSPIEASSGKKSGHRINRGGDRTANAALHRIVLVRMSRRHQPTMDYIARRTAEGLSKRDIIRCLKRYVAREVYHALTHPEPTADISALRPRRNTLGIPMRTVAEHFQRPINAIARLERGQVRDAELAARYHAWLDAQGAA